MWSDQGGPQLEVGCGKLGQWEPSRRAELAADEGFRAAQCTAGWSNTRTFKAFAFLAGPRTGLRLVGERPQCAGE